MPIAADLARQVKSLKHDGPVVFHWHGSGQYEYQLYVTGLLIALRHWNVPFRVDEGFLIRTLGDERRFTGHNAKDVVTIATGPRASIVPSGARRIAWHNGLDSKEQRELRALRARLTDYIQAGKLQMNARGTAYFNRLAALAHQSPSRGSRDAEALLGPSRALINIYVQGFLDLDPQWAARLGRYWLLQTKSDRGTVAIFTAPLGGPGVERLPVPKRP